MGLTITFQAYELPLEHPFTISRYTISIQRTVVVCISDGIFSGYGEATANPYYNSTIESLASGISKVKLLLEAFPELHPVDLWEKLHLFLIDNHFALCAIDMAYWDFYARKNSRTLRSYWSSGNEKTPLTSYTIAIDTIETMKRKILEKPWPLYKIKLGAGNDLKVVESLRKVTDAVFRIDANCAWTADQAIEYSKILKGMNVEFIEQPLKAEDFQGMKKVFAESVLPVIADESCRKESDIAACLGLFHGINIKLMKCGGITPALRMIAAARENGLLLMAGCMTESTVGISGLAQLAPLLDYIDSDGSLLLAKDIASGVTFDSGKIIYADSTGTGAEIYAL